MADQVLVGDVGGTNVRFALGHLVGESLAIETFEKYSGNDFADFEGALHRYLSDTGLATTGLAAVFALAGPPKNDAVKLTNRDWTVSRHSLLKQFGFSGVSLVNDFTAMARAVPELRPDQFEDIRPGDAQTGAPILVAGPGTGFGVATLLAQTDGTWRVLSGEGGFMSYAPETDIEYALAKDLRDHHGYVYNELVCAGIALEKVHAALCRMFDRPYAAMPPAEMLKRAEAGDEMYTELCLIRARGTLCAVGDLVLANGALGGVVLAGGVSERLVPYLKSPSALQRFEQRGRNSAFLANCPIRLMRDPEAPLRGAAALHLRDGHS